jgi:hypothetical protein
MAKTFPTYDVKSFKQLVKEFESVKIIDFKNSNAEPAPTEKIELPNGLYTHMSGENVVIDLNRQRLRAKRTDLIKSVLKKKPRSKKRKKMRRPPQMNMFDIILNATVATMTITFITYLALFLYKTGHLKNVVGIIKQILNLV